MVLVSLSRANTAHQKSLSQFSLFVLSWAIVAFGQPAWIPALCPLAAVCGFALLWFALRKIEKRRFLWASAWYSCVQLVQLSWFTSIEYQGYYILGVYAFLCLALGIEFGLLTKFFFSSEKPHFKQMIAAGSCWTLIEWSRLFFLCGFSWNPVGLAMTSSELTLQLANIWGIYGLTFWVILANGALYLALTYLLNWRLWVSWLVLVLVPYCYGWAWLHAFDKTHPATFSVGLVQTGLLPSQKIPWPGKRSDFIAPIEQWKTILSNLHSKKQKWDLLIFPEAVVPQGADFCVYPFSVVLSEMEKILGPISADQLPPLRPPYAQKRILQGQSVLCLSNAFIAQTIANTYGAEVVVGLDHCDLTNGRNYNAAFYFAPNKEGMKRYDKQVLLPLAEYLPVAWLKTLTRRYGITEFFSHGTQAMVIGERYPLSLSICYEETFPHLIRRGRAMGAELLINMTNDSYYPFSRLAEQHFSLARVRAAENGVALLRACNTGVTAVIDRFGRTLLRLGKDSKESELCSGVLSATIPVQSHQTLYLLWGDAGIVSLALVGLIITHTFRFRRGLRLCHTDPLSHP